MKRWAWHLESSAPGMAVIVRGEVQAEDWWSARKLAVVAVRRWSFVPREAAESKAYIIERKIPEATKLWWQFDDADLFVYAGIP